MHRARRTRLPTGDRRARIEHRPAHEIDVAVGILRELRCHDVGTEKSDIAGELRTDPKHAHLVLDGEAVPGLDLDVGRPRSERLGTQPPGAGSQLLVARGTRRGNRRTDAAGRVRLPAHSRVELLRAVPGEYHVRVAVDEPGDHGPALGVEPRPLDAVGDVRARTDPGDPFALDRDGGIAQHAEWTVAPRRVVGDQLADVVDEH